MSVQFSAPYPFNQTTSIVRNPELNDSYNIKDIIITKKAVDGTLYTYVKRPSTSNIRRRLLMTFLITLHKALELQAFFRAYHSSRIYIKDHLNQEWIGYAVNNPFEFSTDQRAAPGGGGEFTSFSIEFEVVPIGYEGEL